MSGPKPTVLLLGANGQLGTELNRLLQNKYDLRALARDRADFTQPDQLRQIVADWKPRIILNAAAYTAVDRAESEPDLADLVNAKSPEALAQEAARYGGLLVHYSTDYVFDGAKDSPWVEEDPTGPLNVYGRTKLKGEEAIRGCGGNHLIFRTSWIFAPHGKNFLLTILRLAAEKERLTIVADQRGAPTSAAAIAKATADILAALEKKDAREVTTLSGVYHMTAAGETTWYGFAQAILEEIASSGMSDSKMAELVPIPGSDYPTPAKRPANSVLDNSRLSARFGVALPEWREQLGEAFVELRAIHGVNPQ
jgi:dTDP-4-dehydrorhamnose reductase